MTGNKEFVLNKILNTDVSDYPWKHLIIKDFLPPNLYNGVKREISTHTTDPVLQKRNIRAYHIFVNQSAGLMPNTPNLLEYYNILLDESIINAIKNKLLISRHPKDFYSELNLFTQGYNYGEIHPDRSDKLITMLHYLAEEGDDESLGTFLYTPHKNGSELDVFKDRVASAPYTSNCACFFAPCDTPKFKTNHCMAYNSDITFLRSSIQTFWIKEESNWTKDMQSGRINLEHARRARQRRKELTQKIQEFASEVKLKQDSQKE